ncbi:oligosaccharide flippase family protein [Paenibacillus donghaensis]|uniref:oligosaccharide flippase family protein n=1 Tax=Paenibacillus donghaensis TaxID=414771 RepID=UPI0018834FEE|nr:oligosaccharide flippase family protein [Paenibacillus donghaensis]MBE9913888.1 oligosaccharide flippase family protein [Paenibacillus donghaensis]
MSTDNPKMLSSGAVYFCSSVLTQLVNLLLIPLYTRNLTQDQFGQYDLLLSVQMLLSLLIALGVHSGMIRFFNEFENKRELRNTALTFAMLWGAVCILGAWALSPLLSPLAFDHSADAVLFIPYVVMISVFSCLNLIYSSFYSMQFKAMKSSSIQFSVVLSTLLFALYFFLARGQGIIGIFTSQLLANMLVFGVLFVLNLGTFRFALEKKQLRHMLRYGTGLLLGDISAWVLSLSDRFLIKGYMNLSSVAVYSIGYKIGMLINPAFIAPFMSVFTAFKFKAYKDEDGPEKIRKMFRIYNFLGWLCVLGLSLFAHVGVRLVATAEYEAAGYLIPLIAFSYFLSGSVAFYSLGLHIANKMRTNYLISILAAVINVICNLVLIPWLGIYGSALATVISYAVTNAVFYHYGSKYYPLGLSVFFPYKYLILYVPVYALYALCMQLPLSLPLEIGLNMLLVLIFTAASLLFGFINRHELLGDLLSALNRKSKKMIVEGASSES